MGIRERSYKDEVATKEACGRTPYLGMIDY